MRKAMLCGALWLCSGVATAGVPLDLADVVPEGASVAARVDADLTGEGLKDVAFEVVGEDSRQVMVAVRYRLPDGEEGLEPLDSLALETTPHGGATLAVKKGVLVVEDLTGGTTATATTYRFRHDPGEDRMRLIGLDAERYSRTNNHGTLRLSWNLLTGAHTVQTGEPGAVGEAYRYRPERKTVRKSAPVFMAETPNPDALIDAEVGERD